MPLRWIWGHVSTVDVSSERRDMRIKFESKIYIHVCVGIPIAMTLGGSRSSALPRSSSTTTTSKSPRRASIPRSVSIATVSSSETSVEQAKQPEKEEVTPEPPVPHETTKRNLSVDLDMSKSTVSKRGSKKEKPAFVLPSPKIKIKESITLTGAITEDIERMICESQRNNKKDQEEETEEETEPEVESKEESDPTYERYKYTAKTLPLTDEIVNNCQVRVVSLFLCVLLSRSRFLSLAFSPLSFLARSLLSH